MILDLLGAGTTSCIQNCLASAPIHGSTSYGVLLAARSYLLGLRLAMWRAKRWGLDANRVLDLGIYIIIAALVGAKLLLLVVDFDQFQQSPGELLSLARSGGVFYGGLILAVVVAFWYIAQHRLPFWTTCDVFAPGIALGHVTGRLGCLAAGCCYGKPTDVPWAIIFTNPLAAANVGTPLGIPLHPTQLYEAGAELLILVLLLATERRGRPFRRTHVLGVHVPLRGLALRHRDLPRRPARRSCSAFLDVAVHLARPGAAQPGDAVLAVAQERPSHPRKRCARKRVRRVT